MSIIHLLPLGSPKDAGFRPDILVSIELMLLCWWNGPLDICSSRLRRGYGPGSTRYLAKRGHRWRCCQCLFSEVEQQM